jgi:hypothetical protein
MELTERLSRAMQIVRAHRNGVARRRGGQATVSRSGRQFRARPGKVGGHRKILGTARRRSPTYYPLSLMDESWFQDA